MATIKETNLKFVKSLSTRSTTDMIVIHHTASGDMSAADIHREHIALGWSGIGYHYLVHPSGEIERGRPRQMIGSHAEGENWHTIGIALTGNFENEQPTAAQIEAVSNLLSDLCSIYSLTPTRDTVVGHRDVNATACPGRNLYAILQTLRGKAIWYQQNGGE